MNWERMVLINGNKIEEYYWNGKYVVYKNDRLCYNDFDAEVKTEQELSSHSQKEI